MPIFNAMALVQTLQCNGLLKEHLIGAEKLRERKKILPGHASSSPVPSCRVLSKAEDLCRIAFVFRNESTQGNSITAVPCTPVLSELGSEMDFR